MKRILLIVILVLIDLTGLGDLSGLTRAHAQTGGGPSTPLPSATLGTSGASYDLIWWTVDNGGGTLVGAGSPSPNAYTLVGTAGQADASAALTGGGFTLVGGFWGAGGPAGEPREYHVYLPVVIR